MTKIIPIISAGGGVGKTTLSLMISYVLSRSRPRRRVLLVDVDPTAGLTLRMFGDLAYQRLLNERRSLMDLIRDYDSKAEVSIKDYVVYGKQARSYDSDINLYPEFNEVAVLPPGEGFDEFFAENQNVDVGRIVWNILRSSNVDAMFDVVIVDTAPFFDKRYTLIALRNAERAIVVLRPTLTDTNRTSSMITKIARQFQRIGENVPAFTLVFNFDMNKFLIEAKTLSEVLCIERIEMESMKPSTISIAAGRAKRINEALRRNLDELINRKDVRLDYLRFALPHDVKFSDESFPQMPHEPRRRLEDNDKAILELTLKPLIESFGIKIDTTFDIDTTPCQSTIK